MDLIEKWGFIIVASKVDEERLIFYVRDQDGFCAITYHFPRHHCFFYMSHDFYESVFELPEMAIDLFKEFNSRLLEHYDCSFCERPLVYTDDFKIVCVECSRQFQYYMYMSMNIKII